MRLFATVAAVLALCAISVRPQTVTTINPLGQTVVEVITVNLGVPTTQTLQTLTATATTATTTTTTTPQQGNQGPVGQPQTGAAGPTIYTYTTTDALGNTQAVVATFTPSFGPTTGGSITAAPGTIIEYSSWRSLVGTNTVAVVNAGVPRWTVHSQWLAIAVALCAGMTSGVWLAVA